jgi:hypothetical protein
MAVVVAVMVAAALSVGAPAGASPASTTADAPTWRYCDNGDTHVIFRRTNDEAGCVDGSDTIGFAALRRQPGGYRLQVCATDTFEFAMRVDPADANGGSTGDILYYPDQPYGGCYNRDIGYPIRKFQAAHEYYDVNDVFFSGWMLAPT